MIRRLRSSRATNLGLEGFFLKVLVLAAVMLVASLCICRSVSVYANNDNKPLQEEHMILFDPPRMDEIPLYYDDGVFILF